MSKFIVLSMLLSNIGHCFRRLPLVSNTRPSNKISFRLFSSERPTQNIEIYHFKDILKLSSNQINKLDELCDAIKYWNERVNLISRKDIEALVPNHILPSLSIHSFRRFQKDETVIDVGTGGGLPGLPMAIANPDSLFTLIDSNTKKMKVVQNIVDSLKLSNVRVICGRAEEHKGQYDFIMGRAVSALPNFLTWSSHLIVKTPQSKNEPSSASLLSNEVSDTTSIQSGLLYLKGGDFSDELMQSCIKPESVHLTAVTDLLPGLFSEKFVLYVPSHEVIQFRQRADVAAEEAMKASRKNRGVHENKKSGNI